MGGRDHSCEGCGNGGFNNDLPCECEERSKERWTPPEVIGLCPICHDEFYVPHGGKCPGQHDGDPTPDLIEYRPASLLDEAVEALERCLAVPDHNRYGQTSDPDAVLAETRQKLREALTHLQPKKPARCGTCGSDNPHVHRQLVHGKVMYGASESNATGYIPSSCPDPFHKAPAPSEPKERS
jgi:hypothetical protein